MNIKKDVFIYQTQELNVKNKKPFKVEVLNQSNNKLFYKFQVYKRNEIVYETEILQESTFSYLPETMDEFFIRVLLFNAKRKQKKSIFMSIDQEDEIPDIAYIDYSFEGSNLLKVKVFMKRLNRKTSIVYYLLEDDQLKFKRIKNNSYEVAFEIDMDKNYKLMLLTYNHKNNGKLLKDILIEEIII